MPKSRKSIPAKTKALLQQEINSCCPICDDTSVDHFEVHHIDENPENNLLDNLLLLCPICHSKITKGDIQTIEVTHIKNYLSIKNKNKGAQTMSNTININGGIVSNSTLANTITAETIIYKAKSKPKIEYADNAIGRNAEMKNYIKHLIDRYNEYKENELGKGKMNYSTIYSAIKKEFRASTFQIPQVQFPLLYSYIQKRIDNTILGKINKSKGIRNYSKFEELNNK